MNPTYNLLPPTTTAHLKLAMNAFVLGLLVVGAFVGMVNADLRPLDESSELDADYQVVVVPNIAWCFDPERGVYLRCPRRRRFGGRGGGLDVGGRLF